MTDSEGRSCPECGAPRGPDHSPSCDCTERAAEALRETRTAEAAAAADFDPLRIRPYVKVEAVETMEMEGVRGAVSMCGSAATGVGVPPGSSEAGNSGERPATADPQPNDDPPRPTSRSARVLLSVAGAGVAVVAAAGFASGLFSYHAPSRDRAAQEVRESVPDVSTPAPASPTASPSPTVPRPPVPVRRPSPSATASASPTPTATPTPAASATASRPASPTSSMTASPTARMSPAAVPVLRPGDRGPGVAELQDRLWQLNLYDDRIDGVYTRSVEDSVRNYQLARGIQGDTPGVYGPATRRSLEAETEAP
ncbi:peptidoglycan-binding domain-containing protein [Streptomyces sp. NPDC052101]|uniref:peptidoglycan-binding domain-containing protein n=1 Tax=Streptomyces sp. NPDC052101 TaxID=3155763 RepID=UPI003423EA02